MSKLVTFSHNVEEKERTEDVFIKKHVRFTDLMLRDKLNSGLQKYDFKYLSIIQEKGIPIGRCGIDLILEAKSGTGKTIVFGIIALEMIKMNAGLQVMVLTPTREIASQIGNVLTSIGCDFEDLGVEIVMGGTNVKEEVQRLSISHYQILIGSTGRVRHLIKENVIPTDSIRLLVLDEADKLMEDTFQQDINYIFSRLPPRKQVIASSATYTPVLKKFLERYMNAPSHVKPHESSVLLGISQLTSVVPLHHNQVQQAKINFEQLINIISEVAFKQCLVFCNYQTRTRSTYNLLCKKGWPAEYLSSAQSQTERLKSLEALQNFTCKILVATDLGARGIDASNVDLVINLDPPHDLATYLHRIGRAGRFGSNGTAVTILSEGPQQIKFSEMLQQLADQIHNPVSEIVKNSSEPTITECNKEENTKIDEEKKNAMMSQNDNSNIEDFNDILESFKKIDYINETKPERNKKIHERNDKIDDSSVQSRDGLKIDFKSVMLSKINTIIDDLDSFENIVYSFNHDIATSVQSNQTSDSLVKYDNFNLLSYLYDKVSQTKIKSKNKVYEMDENKKNIDVREDEKKSDGFVVNVANKKVEFESVYHLNKRLATQDFTKIVDEDEFEAGCLRNNVKEEPRKSNQKSSKKKTVRIKTKHFHGISEDEKTDRINNSFPKFRDGNHSNIQNYYEWRSRLSFTTKQIQQYVYINTLRELNGI